jgi:hypothetical protein
MTLTFLASRHKYIHLEYHLEHDQVPIVEIGIIVSFIDSYETVLARKLTGTTIKTTNLVGFVLQSYAPIRLLKTPF